MTLIYENCLELQKSVDHTYTHTHTHTYTHILSVIPISPIILMTNSRILLLRLANYESCSFFGAKSESCDYTDHQPIIIAILTFNCADDGGKLLFIIV